MAEMLQYKCPCCGGALEFDSSSQMVKCPYCDTEFDPKSLLDYDAGLENGTAGPDGMVWEQVVGGEWKEDETSGLFVYTCDSCGGQIIGDANMAATKCPYCDNPVIIQGNFTNELKPDYVIPFKLDKEAAKAKFREHLEGKKLLPKVFKSENHLDEIRGIYVPYWLYDADAQGRIRCRGTKLRMWSDSVYDYTETSYYSVVRGGGMSFAKVPADGSRQMPDTLMESLEAYDFSEAVDFQTAYLAGYLADKYDVSSEANLPRVNQRIRSTMIGALEGRIYGYNSVSVESSEFGLSDTQIKYALYPVWLLNTTWRGQQYTFAMNGQTGKFVGDLPVDKRAAVLKTIGNTLLFGLGAAAIALLIALL